MLDSASSVRSSLSVLPPPSCCCCCCWLWVWWCGMLPSSIFVFQKRPSLRKRWYTSSSSHAFFQPLLRFTCSCWMLTLMSWMLSEGIQALQKVAGGWGGSVRTKNSSSINTNAAVPSALPTFGAGGQRSERPPGCLPSGGLWPASNQSLSSWPRPGRGSGPVQPKHTNTHTDKRIPSAILLPTEKI